MASGILFCVILTFSLPLTIFANNTECDVSRGEIWLSGKQVSDFAACEKSCEDEPNCRSITYYDSGSCSHFSTECSATRPANNAISKNLKQESLNGKECDVDQGEIWLAKSEASDLAACKKSCEDDAQCQSVVFYNHGACSRFSTKCENTKPANNAHTEQVKDLENTCDAAGTCNAAHGEECDVDDNEIYMEDGSGKVDDYAACKQACMDRIRCQSVTFYAHGKCSLFKTPCTHRRPVDNAIAETLKTDFYNKQECDTENGEVYLEGSSGDLPDLNACRKSCDDEPKCKSVSYFKSGFCSHYSTCCVNRKFSATGQADSLKLPLCVDNCLTNNGGCDGKRKCTSTDGVVTCGDCPAGFNNDGATGCKPVPVPADPCNTNNGGCDGKRACTSADGVVTCGDCPAGFNNDGATGCKPEPADPCKTNNGGCTHNRPCTSTNGVATCGNCPAGWYKYGAKGCRKDPCKTNNGGCHKQRRCTSRSGRVTCGKCARGYYNTNAKGCKGLCVKAACREGGGASANRPGVGGRDVDCCAGPGTSGCDHGYVHSIIRGSQWNSVPGGRPAGFATCTATGLAGNTCCSKT